MKNLPLVPYESVEKMFGADTLALLKEHMGCANARGFEGDQFLNWSGSSWGDAVMKPLVDIDDVIAITCRPAGPVNKSNTLEDLPAWSMILDNHGLRQGHTVRQTLLFSVHYRRPWHVSERIVTIYLWANRLAKQLGATHFVKVRELALVMFDAILQGPKGTTVGGQYLGFSPTSGTLTGMFSNGLRFMKWKRAGVNPFNNASEMAIKGVAVINGHPTSFGLYHSGLGDDLLSCMPEPEQAEQQLKDWMNLDFQRWGIEVTEVDLGSFYTRFYITDDQVGQKQLLKRRGLITKQSSELMMFKESLSEGNQKVTPAAPQPARESILERMNDRVMSTAIVRNGVTSPRTQTGTEFDEAGRKLVHFEVTVVRPDVDPSSDKEEKE